MGLMLLDGTTIPLPTFRPSRPPDDDAAASPTRSARDIVQALRNGADPRATERVLEALLTVLLRKGFVAEAELADELRRAQAR